MEQNAYMHLLRLLDEGLSIKTHLLSEAEFAFLRAMHEKGVWRMSDEEVERLQRLVATEREPAAPKDHYPEEH